MPLEGMKLGTLSNFIQLSPLDNLSKSCRALRLKATQKVSNTRCDKVQHVFLSSLKIKKNLNNEINLTSLL